MISLFTWQKDTDYPKGPQMRQYYCHMPNNIGSFHRLSLPMTERGESLKSMVLLFFEVIIRCCGTVGFVLLV